MLTRKVFAFKNERFRNKRWYDNFWSNRPKAFGDPNTEINNIIVNIYKELHSRNICYPRAIDIASGNGRYTTLLECLGFHVVAIDISEVACSILKKNLKEKAESIKILCENYLTSNNLDDELFHLVFSSGLLEELTYDQQKRAIEKMKKMTIPFGFVLIKYCLEIKNRGKQVNDGFVESQFEMNHWKVIYKFENKNMKKYPKGVAGEDYIRTGLFYAQKYENNNKG